jgi:hypothetical protein
VDCESAFYVVDKAEVFAGFVNGDDICFCVSLGIMGRGGYLGNRRGSSSRF